MRTLLLTAAIVLAQAHVVAARPTKVALVKLADDDDGHVGKLLATALTDGNLELVSAHKVDRAATRLGLGDDPSDDDLAQLASKVDADAVVTGKLAPGGHRWRFTILAAGKKHRRVYVPVPERAATHPRKQLYQAMVAKLVSRIPAESDPAAAPDTAADPPDAPAASHAAPSPVVADADPAAPAQAVDNDSSVDLIAATTLPPPEGATGGRAANSVAIRADVGSSFAEHSLTFATARSFANAPMPYRNAPIPGGRFAAELYPFAFSHPHGGLAGLGFGGEIDQSESLALHPESDPAAALKTTDRHYAVDVRYRIAFGSSATSPTLTLEAGYGVRTFAVALGALPSNVLDLPDIDYRMFAPGLSFRLPLGSRLAFTLAGHPWLVTSAGQIEDAAEYGHAHMLGGDATVGLELVLHRRYAIRITGEAAEVRYKFTGAGAMTTSRDGDPMTVDVTGATDRYLGGAATLAILY